MKVIQDNETFGDRLKAIYKSQNKIAPLIEGVIPEQSMKDYYVKLQTIIKEDDYKKPLSYESISGKKKEIEVGKIFDKLEGSDYEEKKAPSKLLILGGAGVGKSTLMQHMAYEWAEGNIWQGKFDYIYRITLKTLLNNDWQSKYEKKNLNNSELKCLAHYQLIANLSRKERAEFKLDDLIWPDDKTKMLLLLDGYDEVAHLKSYHEHRDIFEEIFDHQNLVLTSRPNAVDNEMQARFDRKIENTGLDDNGIEQYFTKYFKDTEVEKYQYGKMQKKKDNSIKREELQEFLDQNQVIKAICKIPVNIAMLCYIWSEAESSKVLHEISSMSDLYSQVVAQLGYRYFSKFKGSKVKESGTTMMDLWKEGTLSNLEVFKVLQHVAYKAMTGGIEVSDENRIETLIIKGMQTIRDSEGISILSSINYLKNHKEVISDNLIGIRDVYKYGLLKTEGIVLKIDETSNQLEEEQEENLSLHRIVDDTDLQEQNYSFLHLTFQEYLTVSYFQKMLQYGNDQQKSDICQFIAEHRNEPRYLMALKFMVGIVTADHTENGNKIAKMFWEAVTCNVDGMIELGVETKVTLMMHLLSQATIKIKGKVSRELDSRIPNKQQMQDLIEIVVLKDLLKWGDQLKETDYMTTNIKEGLFRAISDGNLDYCSKKIEELLTKQTTSQELKKAIQQDNEKKILELNLIKEQLLDKASLVKAKAIEIVGKLINKLTTGDKGEQKEFIEELMKIIEINDQSDWQLSKQAMKVLSQIVGQVKNFRELKVEGIKKEVDTEELIYKKVVELIINRAVLVDKNLGQSAIKLICTVLKLSSDKELGASLIINMIKLFGGGYGNVRYEAAEVTSEIIKQIGDKELFLELVRVSIIKLLDDKDSFVRGDGVGAVGNIVKTGVINKDLAVDIIEKLIELYGDDGYGISKVGDAAARSTGEIVNHVGDKDLTVETILKISSLFNHSDFKVRERAVMVTGEIVKHVGDKELVVVTLDKMIKLFDDENECVRAAIVQAVGKIGKQICEVVADNKLTVGIIEKLTNLCGDKTSNVRSAAVEAIGKIVKQTGVVDNDLAETLKKMEKLGEIVKHVEDKDITLGTLEKLSKLFSDGDYKIIASVAEVTGKLVKQIEDKNLVVDIIEKISSLFNHSDSKVRDGAARATGEIVKQVGDKELVVVTIDKMVKLFDDKDDYVRIVATVAIGEILKHVGDKDITLGTLEKLSKLFSDKNRDIRECAAKATAEIVKHIGDKDIVSAILETLSKFFGDKNECVRATALYTINEILEQIRIVDKDLALVLLEKIMEIFGDGDYSVRVVMIQVTGKLVKHIGDKNVALDTLEKLSKLFDDKDKYVKIATIQAIGKMAIQTEDKDLVIVTLKKLSELVDYGNLYVRSAAVKAIGEMVIQTEDKELVVKIMEKLSKLSEHQDLYVRSEAIQATGKLVKHIGDKDLAVETIVKLSKLFDDENYEIVEGKYEGDLAEALGNLANQKWVIIVAAVKAIGEMAIQTEDKDLAIVTIKKLSRLFSDKSEYIKSAVVEVTGKLVKHIGDKNVALDTLEKLSQLFDDRKATVKQIAIKTSYEILKQIIGIVDNDLVAATLKKISNLCGDKDSEVRAVAAKATGKLVKRIGEKNLALDTLDNMGKLANYGDSHVKSALSKMIEQSHSLPTIKEFNLLIDKYVDLGSKMIEITSKNILSGAVRGSDLKNYLHDGETLKALRDRLVVDLTASFQEFFTKQQKIDKLKWAGPSIQILLSSELNYIGNNKVHQLIEVSLAIIGEDPEPQETDKKELVMLAKKMITKQIELLSLGNGEGLKWINENFMELITLSKVSKEVFIRKLYHKILEHSELTEVDKELIVKFINQGLTTSLTRKGEIIFEGKKHKLKGENIDTFIEELATVVINQKNDVLAVQYIEHKPIFPKSSNVVGMRKAAADIEDNEIISIVNEEQRLSSKECFLTDLDLKGQNVVLLELRSAMGDHLIYQMKVNGTAFKLLRVNPANSLEDDKKLREEIFGKYENQIGIESYNAKSTKVPLEVGNVLIKCNDKDIAKYFDGTFKIEEEEFFKDELLKTAKIGRDRIKAMGQKVDDTKKDVHENKKKTNVLTTEVKKHGDRLDDLQMGGDDEDQNSNKELLIPKKTENKTCCERFCTIFSLTEIKYDNPILNHPEILKTLTNNLSRSLSFWEVVDRVNNFDKEFVEEVCLSGSVELLQECFDSQHIG